MINYLPHEDREGSQESNGPIMLKALKIEALNTLKD